MADKTVNTQEELRAILNKITFAPSCVNLDWQWDIEAVYGEETYFGGDDQMAHPLRGWLVNTSFLRPDTNTGVVGRGKGRLEFIPVGCSESGVAKTCWVLAEMIVNMN